MLRFEGHVRFENGDEDEFSAGPMVLAEWEAYAHRNNLPIEHDKSPMLHMAFIAWKALNRGKNPPSFEAWRATVDTFDIKTVEVTPTGAASAA